MRRYLKIRTEYLEESREERNQAPLFRLVISAQWLAQSPSSPLKSHANVIYVPKLATSTAHPHPKIFACEDCTATPVRRWRQGMWEREIEPVKEQCVLERNSYSSVSSAKVAGYHKPQPPANACTSSICYKMLHNWFVGCSLIIMAAFSCQMSFRIHLPVCACFSSGCPLWLECTSTACLTTHWLDAKKSKGMSHQAQNWP